MGPAAGLSHPAVAGTTSGPGHSNHHGVSVPCRGSTEPGCNTGGETERQPGVSVSVGVVPVLATGEEQYYSLYSWLPVHILKDNKEVRIEGRDIT